MIYAQPLIASKLNIFHHDSGAELYIIFRTINYNVRIGLYETNKYTVRSDIKIENVIRQ